MEPGQAALAVAAAISVSVALQFVLGAAGASAAPDPTHSRSNLHVLRKIQHALTGLVFVLVLETGLPPELGGLAMLCAAAGFWLLHLARLRIPAVQTAFLAAFAPIMRDHERTSVPGAAYFLVGCGVLACLAPRPVVGAGILVISIGDPVASAAGVLYGATAKHFGIHCAPSRALRVLPGLQLKLWHGKSLLGFLAGTAASFIAVAAYWVAVSPREDVCSMLSPVTAGCVAPPGLSTDKGVWGGVFLYFFSCRGALLPHPWQIVPHESVSCVPTALPAAAVCALLGMAAAAAAAGALAEALEVSHTENTEHKKSDDDDVSGDSSARGGLLQCVLGAVLVDDNVRVPLAAGAAVALLSWAAQA